mmetsp:Transcript_32000/g.36794  ORF Transcript_32000/g.36794 Transcript_32000/m.36794 type:complete len:1275 (+) Transcript_32000:52-3876(+)
MAPREATGTFPDQFLTFDYDISANMVVPPPQHDPFPIVAAGQTQIDLETNLIVGGGGAQDNNDNNMFNGLQQTAGTNPNTSHGGVGPPNTTNSQHQQQHHSSQEVVDPLSIDPTINQASRPLLWEADNLNTSTSNASTMLRIPHMPPIDHPASLSRGISGTSTVTVRTVNPVYQRHALTEQAVSVSQQQQHQQPFQHQHSDIVPNTAGAINVASPLSYGPTGMSYGGMLESTANGGLISALSSPSPSHGSLSSSAVPTDIGRNHPRRIPSSSLPSGSRRVSTSGSFSASARRVSSNSILSPGVTGSPLAPSPSIVIPKNRQENATNNDEDDKPPGLDITYDSMASASFYTTTSPSQDWGEEDDDVDGNNGDNIVCVEDEDEHSFPGGVISNNVSPIMSAVGGPIVSSNASAVSSNSSFSSMRMIQQTSAFDLGNYVNEGGGQEDDDNGPASPSGNYMVSSSASPIPTSPNSIMLSFGPSTSVADLKYFAERGCIVALLQALTTPRLVTLGTRMLADYAKMSHRRVAVASNRRILEFVQRTMLHVSEQNSDWLGREYAVETVRSLTATEESDRYLMGTYGLLNTLALVARGGPFVASNTNEQHGDDGTTSSRPTVPLASEKARLHACIAIMNLSCGKANKIEIAKIPEVLEAMRDVMLNSGDEARLKATTCIKNLSNADANDGALLGTPGLVEALGRMAAVTCSPETGATPCTTNACLALMNLSISKSNKHKVFRTSGVMNALMTVLERTTAQGSSTEARIKACSALSNLAIGYDNKIPMFNYPGFVDAILNVIQTDRGEARTKACSILWSFAAEMKNQVPVVQRGDILPVLVRVAEEDGTTEARFKCVAALTLLAESLENAIPLLESGALSPLMDILHEAGPDPTQWKGQTASWCVGFLMNIAQSDEAVPTLREAGVVELLAPLLTLDHYQSLKAAMAVTFVCRYDEGDECYDLLRKTENVIPKIISLLHNTLSGRGGNGYKYGVFTLRSSVGCISALALGPDFMKERIATGPVYESLLRVLSDFCVDGGTPGAIVGGGRDDVLSATLAVRALQSLTAHLIPIAGYSALPFGQSMEDRLLTALISLEESKNDELKEGTRQLAIDAKVRIQGSRKAGRSGRLSRNGSVDVDMTDVASLASNCCGLDSIHGFGDKFLHALTLPSEESKQQTQEIAPSSSMVESAQPVSLPAPQPVRTFLLADVRTGRRFAVPTDPSGGRAFNDARVWCYRRGRFCQPEELPDSNFVWTEELQRAYQASLAGEEQDSNPSTPPSPSD